MADFVVDRTSPAYLLGVAEYERGKYKKALEQILAGSKNADIGNSEFRLKALQTAQGVLGHVGGSRDA